MKVEILHAHNIDHSLVVFKTEHNFYFLYAITPKEIPFELPVKGKGSFVECPGDAYTENTDLARLLWDYIANNGYKRIEDYQAYEIAREIKENPINPTAPQLLPHQLVNVQPMTTPTKTIYKMNFK